AMGLLRVSQEGEAHGLDLHEHGISAYPEYVISSMGKPAAVVLDHSQSYAMDPAVKMKSVERPGEFPGHFVHLVSAPLRSRFCEYASHGTATVRERTGYDSAGEVYQAQLRGQCKLRLKFII